jgi:hypothetical protein
MTTATQTYPSTAGAQAAPSVKPVHRRITGTIRLPVGGSKVADAALPHERDESAGMTDGNPSEPIQQAYRDVERGLQDTDRGAEAGRTYEKLKP